MNSGSTPTCAGLDSESFDLPGDAGSLSVNELQAAAPWSDDWHTLVIIDGSFAPELSRNLEGDGIAISTISEAAAAEDHSRVKEAFAQSAAVEGNAFTAPQHSSV